MLRMTRLLRGLLVAVAAGVASGDVDPSCVGTGYAAAASGLTNLYNMIDGTDGSSIEQGGTGNGHDIYDTGNFIYVTTGSTSTWGTQGTGAAIPCEGNMPTCKVLLNAAASTQNMIGLMRRENE